MTNRKAFLEEEIPYDKLEKIGIDRRAFLSMPKNLVDPIINGKVSPIIKAHIKAENGKTIEMPMKIQLTHDDQGMSNSRLIRFVRRLRTSSILLPVN